MEYKVGDWCVCIKDYSNIWYSGRVWQIGKIEDYFHNDFTCNPIENSKILNQSLLVNSKGFRHAYDYEIPGYIPLKPESYKYLTKLFKKLKIK